MVECKSNKLSHMSNGYWELVRIHEGHVNTEETTLSPRSIPHQTSKPDIITKGT